MDSYESRVLQEMMVTLRDIKELMEKVVESIESNQEKQPEVIGTVSDIMGDLCHMLDQLPVEPSREQVLEILSDTHSRNSIVFDRENVDAENIVLIPPNELVGRIYWGWNCGVQN